MATTQDGRLLSIATPLGKDFVLLNGFTAEEGVSRLYRIEAELLHEESTTSFEPTVVDPKSLLGHGVMITVNSTDGLLREFSGLVNEFSQGIRHTRFTSYRVTIVPHVWLLTQRGQSRIFQNTSVPNILKKVFEGFDVKFELQATYEPRNYCVQYRETDFDFASRLMEEEGIFYFFQHDGGKTQMIFADTPQSNRDCPGRDTILFHKIGEQTDAYSAISEFNIDYRIRTGKVTRWDHNFQLPSSKLELEKTSIFQFGDSQKLEHYDFPAGYGRKFDGIDSSGGEQASELNKVFEDREKTVRQALEALDAGVVRAKGQSDCCVVTSGYRFTLSNHPNAEMNKQYVLTSVSHSAEQSPAYVSDTAVPAPYSNAFECILYGAGQPPFRPERKTAKPIVHGSQTAIVVGPAGEEIFTDKYGRVKVQFHWDREGQDNEASSCWIRVAQIWAGNKWGTMFIPRIGMEVVVSFLEGDPDQPIIVGSVYNPQTMPPYTLPDHKTKSTMKSNSSKGGAGFNEFRFEDLKGSEQIFMHGEKDLDIRIKNDRREIILNDRHLIVNRDKRERIKRDDHVIIDRDQIEKIGRDHHLHIVGKAAYKTDQSHSYDVGGNYAEKVGQNYAVDVTGNYSIKANQIVLEANTGLTIKVGGNFVTINPAGVQINGTMVMINSGGAALPGTPGNCVPPTDPMEAEIADNADPGSNAPTYRNQRAQMSPVQQLEVYSPTHKPKSPAAAARPPAAGQKEEKKVSWIEIELVDDDGKPVPGEKYIVTLPDGKTVASGTLDENGFARVEGIEPGTCKVTFPNLDKPAWEKK